MKIAGIVRIWTSHGGDTQKPLRPFNKQFIGMSIGHVTKAAVQLQKEEDPVVAAEQPFDGGNNTPSTALGPDYASLGSPMICKF
jgi:hypothetical protein